MTGGLTMDRLAGKPEEWRQHGEWAWEAQPLPDDPFARYPIRTSGLRGWTTCGCGFASFPDKDSGLPPLTYTEAMQAYIDHLPPGMAVWLVEEQKRPQTDGQRIARVCALIDQCDESGSTSLSVELVKDALGWRK